MKMANVKHSVLAGAFALSLLAGGGSALADHNPPGQAKAAENCDAVVMRQTDKGVSAGGGPKAGFLAPTNCDKFFQDIGVIGKK